MNFYARLIHETADARLGLLNAPIIQGCLPGEGALPVHLAFLRCA